MALGSHEKARSRSEDPKLQSLSNVLIAMVNTEDGFYEVLGPLVKSCCGKRRFDSVWRVLCKGYYPMIERKHDKNSPAPASISKFSKDFVAI